MPYEQIVLVLNQRRMGKDGVAQFGVCQPYYQPGRQICLVRLYAIVVVTPGAYNYGNNGGGA